MNKNFYSKGKRRSKKQSFFLLVLLFILATIIPPVVAEVSNPTLIVQTQQNPTQLVTQAQELYQNQQFETAVQLWEQAAKAFANSGDNLNQAMALSNLSLTYQQLGQWQAASTAIQESLQLINTQPGSDRPTDRHSQILAQTLDIQGKLQRETGQTADAIASWQQAANIYQKLDNSPKLVQNQLNQAQALEDLGLYPRACQTLLAVLESDLAIQTCPEFNQLTPQQLTEKLQKITTQSSLSKVSALRSLGDLLRVIGQIEQSKQILATSLTLAEQLELPQELANTYLSIGNTSQILAEAEKVRRLRQQYQEQALDAYAQAIRLSPSLTTQQPAKLNQLSFFLKLKKWSEAKQLWRSLQPSITNLPPSRTNISARINFTQSLIKLLEQAKLELPTDVQLPEVDEIGLILKETVKQAQILGDSRLQAYALGNLGKLYEVTQQYSSAEKYTRQALILVSNFDASDISYQYFWQLGRIQNRQGDIEKAIAAYTKAFDALQFLRRDLASINPEVQFSFRDEVEPVYRELVELDLRSAESLEKAGNKKESKVRLTQARTAIESLQLAELNNFFREACIDANPQQIDEIDPSAAVIYPIILSDKLEVLLSLPNQPPSLYTTSATKQEVEDTVEQIKLSLITPISKAESYLPQYQQVYNWLIRPLETELIQNKVKTIAFVLDGDLRNIPMSVLYDGNKYLVEKYALALTPGLQLLNPKPLTAIELNALTAGLSEIRPNFEPHRDFGDLPKVPEELRTIREIGLTERSLLNDQFTQEALKQNITASGSPIIHLATHAKFSSKVEDTFILSWDGRINIKDLEYLLRDDTFNRQNAIELLVLSACETASGDKRATLGLAGVAVQAGARSTLATLWSVVDPSTAKIMGEFYRQLEQTGTTKANKAEALRQAQLTLLKDKQFNHPHFWAPFILVGNWQ